MSRSKGSGHPVARRVALASMAVLASSGIGLVAAPMAFGQIVIPIGGPLLGGGVTSQSAGVTNSGSASANTGGNAAVGNSSTNTATATAPSGTGLLDVPISLGAPTNTSGGSATITSGAANAVGNTADTTVGQSTASGSQVNNFLGSQQQQGAGVTNAGAASANTGGNTAIGNGSTNTATVGQNVNGGLLGVGVSLGGPTNNSTGTATINTGPANAVGNTSSTDVGQAASRGGGGGPGFGGPGSGGPGFGPGACGTGRFVAVQDVEVNNRGQARADTGNNVAIGNASTNDASVTVPQTVSGGLLGVGLTIGGPVNNSSGTAVINTGPATAVGNESVTVVGQTSQQCPQVTTLGAGRHPIAVAAHHHPGTAPKVLARTGLDTGDLGMIAGALVGAGMLLVASQRRRLAARHATANRPMAGFGLGLGADDWDRPVR